MLIHYKQRKKEGEREREREKRSRPTSSRQLCMYCMPSLNTKNRRLVRSERERIRERNARRLVFLLIIQFVLSFCHSFFFYFTRQMENGTILSFFSLIILVIYDGGRHPIEIVGRNIYI